METRITSSTKEVLIDSDQPIVLIGERMNPSANKKLAEALRKGNLEIVRNETLGQVQPGADILDANVGAGNVSFGLPDRELLNSAFTALAVGAGVNCLLTDAAKSRSITLAVDLLSGRDKRGRR